MSTPEMTPPSVTDEQGYRVRQPAVVGEAIDGEVIVINLDTGTYYTLSGVAVIIWAALERGATRGEVIAAVATAHPDADRSAVAASVEALLDDVLAENLIAAVEPGALGDREPLAVTLSGEAFTPPTLERYIDMQTLIQLDPILEVDEQGYPRTTGA